MESVSRFATADAAIAPLPLIAPFNRRNWLALAPDVRLAAIRTNVTKQITASHIERHARRVAKSKAPAPAGEVNPSPVKEVTPRASRYVVACARGCGEFLPARSAQSVSVKCKTPCRAGKAQRSGAKPTDDSVGIEQLLAQLQRDVQEKNTGDGKRKR